jgi:hypothetical protein
MKRPCITPLLLTFLFFTSAQAGVKNVESTLPRFGQCGTTVDVEIQGVSIEHPREVIFFKPGIRAYDLRKADTQPARRGFAHGGYLDSAIACRFEISPDCPPGEYAFRLLTATELSHLGTFHVSPFLTVNEDHEPNNSLDQAMEVTPNSTINGVLGHDPEDFYRVPVKAGQLLSVELNSVRISDQNYGDSEFDLAVRVLNSDGRQIAANDDNSLHLQDPVVSTKIDFDGHVFVVVERSVKQPHRTRYAVHIGTNRRPMIAFPLGGPSGTQQTFRMIGDASGDFEETLVIPRERGEFEFFGDAPSSLKLRSSPFPNVLEDGAAAETSVQQLPAALNGVIDRHDDVDAFRFTARTDESLHIRVFAAAMGSPIDARIRIRPINSNGLPGEVDTEADDSRLTDRDVFGTSYRGGGGRPGFLDPSILWEPKADGEYVLEISDSSGAGGTTGVYRIEIERPRTVLQTVLQSRTFDWTESTRFTGLALPQGGRWTVNVSFPSGQWNRPNSPFDLVAHGLPKGVRLISPRVPHGVTIWPMQLVAEPGAKVGGAAITLEARPVDPTIPVESRSQENIPFLNHPGGDALHHVQVDRYIMGVTDPARFTLDIDPPRAALVRGGELAIPVKITRRNGFKGPVEYWVGFVDRSVSSQPPTTIEAGETESILQLAANSSAPLATLPLVVLGRSLEDTIPRSMGAGDRRASSEIVQLTVAEPYVELASQPASIRRGETKEFTFTANHKTPFEGEAFVRLLGLPKGVTTNSTPHLKSDTTTVVFELTATNEALLGQAKGLNCEVVVSVAGQEITQRTGRGTLRIDPALQ